MKAVKLFLGFMLLLLIACTERPKSVSNSTVSTDSVPNELLMLNVQLREGALISLLLEAENAEVDWGDGCVEQTMRGAMEHKLFHRYSAVGEHKISVCGINVSVFILDDCVNIGAISELSCKGCVNLKTLYCSTAKLQKLDVRECPSLNVLLCHTNLLKNLDISRNTDLAYLDCSSNDMRKLDLTGCTGLRYLMCGSNEIEELNIEKNEKLEFLDCSSNRLKSLNVLRNEAVQAVNCANNRMDIFALNALFTALPEVKDAGDYRRIYVNGNDGAKVCNFTIADDKGWEVVHWW